MELINIEMDGAQDHSGSKDNHGRPRIEYFNRISAMDERGNFASGS